MFDKNESKQSGFSFINQQKKPENNIININPQNTDKINELTNNIFKAYNNIDNQTPNQNINYINFNQPSINIQNTYYNPNQNNNNNNPNSNYNMQMMTNMNGIHNMNLFNNMSNINNMKNIQPQRPNNFYNMGGLINQNDLYNKVENKYNSYSYNQIPPNNINLDLGTQKAKKEDPFQNLYSFK
jgi:hypothetical protein